MTEQTEKINGLIVALTIIDNFSKDIHYTAHGDSFFAKHLFADKFNFAEDIDLLKECCLLGAGERPSASKVYLKAAEVLLVEPKDNNDRQNFTVLYAYINKTLELINNLKLDAADANVIGNIAQKLKQYLGLINLQIEE